MRDQAKVSFRFLARVAASAVVAAVVVSVPGDISARRRVNGGTLTAVASGDNHVGGHHQGGPAAVGGAVTERAAERPPPRKAAEESWRHSKGFNVASASSVQTWSLCDNNWDCGSAPTCDPTRECGTDFYSCVISQKTGRGQCVHRGVCDRCR